MGRAKHTRSLAAYFKDLKELITEEAKKELKDGAEIVVKDAKSRCPKDTGNLRRSIRADERKQGMMWKISANATVKQRDPQQDNKVVEIPYGQFVEFDPRINHPFLYPAKEAHNDEIKEKVMDAIRRGAKRAES